LTQEFQDGLKLISFLEVISGKSFSKYEKKPKMRIHKIQNVDMALKFLKESKVQLISISAEGMITPKKYSSNQILWTETSNSS
jgi:hypothetical protein